MTGDDVAVEDEPVLIQVGLHTSLPKAICQNTDIPRSRLGELGGCTLHREHLAAVQALLSPVFWPLQPREDCCYMRRFGHGLTAPLRMQVKMTLITDDVTIEPGILARQLE